MVYPNGDDFYSSSDEEVYSTDSEGSYSADYEEFCLYPSSDDEDFNIYSNTGFGETSATGAYGTRTPNTPVHQRDTTTECHALAAGSDDHGECDDRHLINACLTHLWFQTLRPGKYINHHTHILIIIFQSKNFD